MQLQSSIPKQCNNENGQMTKLLAHHPWNVTAEGPRISSHSNFLEPGSWHGRGPRGLNTLGEYHNSGLLFGHFCPKSAGPWLHLLRLSWRFDTLWLPNQPLVIWVFPLERQKMALSTRNFTAFRKPFSRAHLRWTGNGCPIENPLPVLGRSWLLPHLGVLTEEPQNHNAKRVNKMTWMIFIYCYGVPPWLSWLRTLPYSTSEQEVQNKMKLLHSDACQPREFKCRSIAGWWQNLCHEELVALFHDPSLA